jgi:hypothetical protein
MDPLGSGSFVSSIHHWTSSGSYTFVSIWPQIGLPDSLDLHKINTQLIKIKWNLGKKMGKSPRWKPKSKRIRNHNTKMQNKKKTTKKEDQQYL